MLPDCPHDPPLDTFPSVTEVVPPKSLIPWRSLA